MNAIEESVALAGSQQKLAAKVCATQQAVSGWLSRGETGDRFVIAVAAAVDFKITPHQLRPDLYPHPEDGLPPELRGITKMQAAVAAQGAR